MFRFLLLTPVLYSLLLSCSAAIEGPQEKLRLAVIQFNDGVRWGKSETVLSFVDTDAREHFLEMHREFGKMIKVSDYEIVRTEVDMSQNRATIGVRIGWYRMDRMEVHETELEQRWEWRDRQWVMIAESYVSGTPF